MILQAFCGIWSADLESSSALLPNRTRSLKSNITSFLKIVEVFWKKNEYENMWTYANLVADHIE